MTRTLYKGFGVCIGAVLAVLTMSSLVFANEHRYDYDYSYDYDYNYQNYDNSINHSFNNYDGYNDYGYYDYDRYYDDYTYSYGYPYSNYAYSYPSSYDYNNYYNSGYRSYDGYSYGHRPTCSISTYRTSGTYRYDNSITVTWWSSGATSAYLSGVGSVNPSGSQVMYAPYTSSYTLTVSGPGGSTSCSASNPYYSSGSYYDHNYRYGYVANPTFTYPVYSYPYVSGTVYPTYPAYNYVQLSQTPYTGFDFGIVGNSLYWLAMILVAALGAYLIVYSHSGAYPRMFVREVVQAARNQVRAVKSLVK